MHISALVCLLFAAAAPPPDKADKDKEKKDERVTKWDMTEAPPVVTHHEIELPSGTLKYKATAGRMPIKDAFGNTDALMFYVAYTVEAKDASKRPLTFAFNGGPGSATIWLHLGVLGPRKVVMQDQGFMPAAPFRVADNPQTPLDKTDIVLVDMVGAGYSRPADMEKGKKFWGLDGDISAFGEFIRAYLSRNERWSSPLFLMGESYGTTRAAGLAGSLGDRTGIVFNGIILMSTVLDFQTLVFHKRNDEPFILTLPSYAMIANYHGKLAGDPAKLRGEVENWIWQVYAPALIKGDALSAQEKQAVLDGLSRYTGLKPDLIDAHNLRIDVHTFTAHLLGDQKLKVGRLDGRFKGPDPEGEPESFFDPTFPQIRPPYTSAFNDYVRRELNYKSDLPYNVFVQDMAGTEPIKWDWGNNIGGYPDTASALRAAMARNPYLKILVLEGYYDLATPYYAANYTLDHLALPADLRKNIQVATYGAGHMMYMERDSLVKLGKDLKGFIDASVPKQ